MRNILDLGCGDDMEDIEDTIKNNLGLIYAQLHKFHLVDDHDAISLAYEALYNAANTYDNTKNSKFSTYATVCIYNALGSHVRYLKRNKRSGVDYYERVISSTGQRLVDTLKSSDSAEGRILGEEGESELQVIINSSVLSIKGKVLRAIAEAWIRSDYSATQKELAAEVGCTQTYVSQAIGLFKTTVKRKLEAKKYERNS